MGNNYRHLRYSDRLLIERLTLQKKSVKEIVEITGFSKATIYRQLSKYKYIHTNSDLTTEMRYSADKSQIAYNENRRKCKKMPKILLDDSLRGYITYMIKKYKYSPSAVILSLKSIACQFKTLISSVNTIYRSIYNGLLKEDGVDVESLHYKKSKYRKRDRYYKTLPLGTSITLRTDEINNRLEFGHWEGDCVVGNKESKTTLFVLTERKTRYEIIMKMKSQTADEVRKAMNRLEKKFGSKFYSIFKSITVDNGTEFTDTRGMEKALYRVGNRTKVYYCHPYRPDERGTNENQNKLIRVWFPKRQNFDNIISRKNVQEVQEWMNLYPRKLFNGQCALEKFQEELEINNIHIDL